MPAYASRLLGLTVQLALLVAIVVSPFMVACVASAIAGIPLLEFLSSMTGILYSTVIAVLYASLRIKVVGARL